MHHRNHLGHVDDQFEDHGGDGGDGGGGEDGGGGGGDDDAPLFFLLSFHLCEPFVFCLDGVQ